MLEPLSIASCVLYAANRWLMKPHIVSPFLRGHFNDLLLIPCALPVVLWLQRRLGLRTHDSSPTLTEIALHLAIWTLIAEFLGPRWLHRGTGDVWDAAAYTFGAIVAVLAWKSPTRSVDLDR